MDSDHFHHHQYNHIHNQQQQQQQQQPMSSGLARYRSAPSSYFASLINGGVGGGGCGGEDCDETERIFSSFMSGGGNRENSSSHSLRDVRQNGSPNEALQSQFAEPMKHEAEIFHQHDRQPQQMIYQNQPQQLSLQNHKPMESNSVIVNSYRMDSLPQMKTGGGGGGGGRGCGGNSSLIRQSSSPAGLFSHINVENGYGAMRAMGNIGGANGTNAEASFPSPSRLKSSQVDFSSVPTSSLGRMTPILENRSKSMEITGFPIGSWDDSAIFSDSFLQKLEEDDDRKTFSVMNASENQNAEGGNRSPTVLSHHLSLPTSSSELSAMEKLLHFQDSVPCKIRAKRGFATHPRSIAERVRRTQISERMRKLQELVPNMDKQTNTADMLDLAVDHIKDLQTQVKTLQDNRAKCTCSNKQRE